MPTYTPRRRLKHETWPLEVKAGFTMFYDLPRWGYIHRIVFEPMAPHVLCSIRADGTQLVNRVPLSKRLRAIYIKADMRQYGDVRMELHNVSPNLDYSGLYVLRMSIWT